MELAICLDKSMDCKTCKNQMRKIWEFARKELPDQKAQKGGGLVTFYCIDSECKNMGQEIKVRA